MRRCAYCDKPIEDMTPGQARKRFRHVTLTDSRACVRPRGHWPHPRTPLVDTKPR